MHRKLYNAPEFEYVRIDIEEDVLGVSPITPAPDPDPSGGIPKDDEFVDDDF